MAPRPWVGGKPPTETFDPASHAGDGVGDDELGALPARFRIVGELGRGGMGVVLEVEDRTLGRAVALKVLPPGRRDAAQRARFVREARAAASLRHPSIVAVYDVDPDGAFIVMELVRGGSLADRLDGTPLPPAEVRRIAHAMLSGLAAAHAAGVVHRDVKPGNVLLGEDGAIKLADFGIASVVERDADGDDRDASATGDDREATATGARLGTPAYMAPEQRRGRRADVRADVYAAGATLYEMATGRPLHAEDGTDGDAGVDVEARVRAATGDRRLASAIARAVRERAEDRFADAAALDAAITAIAAPPDRPRPRAWMLELGALVASAGAIAANTTAAPEAPTARAAALVPPPRLAMLPFADRTGVPQLDYASYGLPHLLATELVRVGDLDVIDHHRLAGIVGPDQDEARWRAAAAELGAGLVVDGEIAGAGPIFDLRIRVRTAAGAVLVARTTTAPLADVPQAVRALAPAIATAVLGRPVIAPPARRGNADAEAFLQRGIAELAAHDINAAGDDLARAVALDGGNAEAHYYRALQTWWMSSPADEVRAAIGRVDRDRLTAPQRQFLDGLTLFIAHDYAGAAAHFARQRTRFADDRDLLYGHFEALFHAGRSHEAIAIYRALHARYPRFGLGVTHVLDYFAVRGDPAGLAWGLALLDGAAGASAPVWGGLAALSTRDYPTAIARLQAVLDDDRVAPVQRRQARDALAFTHALGGQAGFARALVEEDDGALGRSLELAWAFAEVAGDTDGARAAEAALLASIPGEPRGAARMVPSLTVAAMYLAGDRAPADLADAAARLQRETPAERLGDASPAAIRTLLACRTGDDDALAAAAGSPFAEVVALVEACRAERSGALDAARAAWRRALDPITDARLAALAWQELARLARAAGDRASVRAACDEVVRPRYPTASWGPAAARCRLWSLEAALGDGDRAAAAVDLAVLERTRRPGDALLASARRAFAVGAAP